MRLRSRISEEGTMIRGMIVMVAAAVMLCGLPVRAADTAGAPDSHFAAALALLEATNSKANMATVIDSMIPLVLSQIRARNPSVSEAAVQQFQSAFREEMYANLDDLMKLTARLYEEHFTENELRELT